jgi:osmotically-inducible protein OsmY
MKNTITIMAAAILAVGCDQQQRQASNDTSTSSDKSTIRQSAREAKSAVDQQARAEKEMLDKEAKAAQAKIDAEKARVKAQTTDAQAKVNEASQNIQDAAGAASTKAQTEVGAAKSEAIPPATPTPANPPTATIPPATSANTANEADQKLTSDVRLAVTGANAEVNADAAKAIQVSVSAGTVTLKGNVKTEAEKSQAETAAKAVPGVTKVDNQLQVKE